MDPADQAAEHLNGKMDIIHTASFFHLFSWEDQIIVGSRLVRFFKPEASRPMLLGRQVGSFNPPPHPSDPRGCPGKTLHSVETFQRLWEIIGERTGTKWKVDGSVNDESDGLDEHRIVITFVVTRVESP